MRATHLAPIFCLVNIAFSWPYTPKGGLGTNSTSPERIAWQNFPALNITSNPNATGFFNTSIFGNDTIPAITRNRTIFGNDTIPAITRNRTIFGNDTIPAITRNRTIFGNDTIPAIIRNRTIFGNDTTPAITRNRTTFGNDTTPAITRNGSVPLSFPGRELFLSWENPGIQVGSNSFTTNTTAGPGRFVAWISQLSTTFTALTDVNGTTGKTIQPDDIVFGDNLAPIVNGTMSIAITDEDVFVTPLNLSLLNPHIVAGPGKYQSG